jgi:dinuclear metal center YbgI/SA1388 family protein
MTTTKDILQLINEIAPFEISEAWDNSGLQAGDLNGEVKKIMIALDVSTGLMDAAKKWNADVVLTHHPLMISPVNSFDFNELPGSAVKIAARHNISIISAHTNLDKATDGLNDYFAGKIGIKNTKVFISENLPGDTSDVLSGVLSGELTGLGRIGSLDSAMPLAQVAQIIKEKLNLPHVRITGDMDLPVKTIAICTGSGGSLIGDFLRSGADLYITGDVKYHEARLVEENSKALMDVGHFGSEHMVIKLLADKLAGLIKKKELDIKIKEFKNEKDPFIIV